MWRYFDLKDSNSTDLKIKNLFVKYILIPQTDQNLNQFCPVIKKNIANYSASFHYSGHAIARFVVLQVKISPSGDILT
jgi:hypothetical protein